MSIPKSARFESFEDSRFWSNSVRVSLKNEMYDDEESQTRIRHLISSVDQVAKQFQDRSGPNRSVSAAVHTPRRAAYLECA